MSARRNILLVLGLTLLLFGGVLRIHDLENNPPGLWQDEASTGLDAYLLWTSGKDRAGVDYPIIARSFGDYPLALYRYLDAPIVGIFGLSITTERMVAALAGTLLIAFGALLLLIRVDTETAISFLLTAALCPMWLHFSRYGSEAILMPAALMLGWLLIELGRRPGGGRRWLLWLGALSLASSAYTYHAVKLFLPLWVLGFLIYLAPLIRELWKKEKLHLFGPVLIFALAVLPSVWAAFTPEGQARPNTVVAWKHHHGLRDIARIILNNYLTYFDPGMLFVRGGPAAAQSIPYLGIWNLIELPLIIVALIAVARSRSRERRALCFVIFWLLLGPLPGGITYESQNIGRSIGWLPAPQILSAYGMVVLLRAAVASRSRALRFGIPLALGMGWVATALAVVRLTWFVYPDITQHDWQYEISTSMKCAEARRTNGERLIVSPHFQMAAVFARFFYSELPPLPDGKSAWELGERVVVGKGELYVFPANRPKPTGGKEVCAIATKPSGRQVSYVYAHEDHPR